MEMLLHFLFAIRHLNLFQLFLQDRLIAGACRLARDSKAKAILCITNSGYTAFRLSAHRPKADLYVFTSNKELMSTMGLLWGARVFFYDPGTGNAEKTVAAMVDKLKQDNLLSKGDIFVTTLSVPANQNKKTTLNRKKCKAFWLL